MARKDLDVGDYDRLAAHGCRATYALAHGDADAGGSALKGSENELLPVAQKIESGPVQIRKRLEHQGGGVGSIGNGIAFSFQQRFELLGDFPVQFRFGNISDRVCFEHCVLPGLQFWQSRAETFILGASRNDRNVEPQRRKWMKVFFAKMRGAMPEGSRPFLRTPDGRRFSYDDMLARSGQFANCLHAAGLRPGDRLAVQVEKSAEALLLYLACLRTGAIYVPLNPAQTSAETSYFLADTEPICFIAAPEKAEAIRTLLGDPTALLTLGDDGRAGSLAERAGSTASGFDDAERAGDDVAAILYTLTQRNLASNALALRDLWRFSPRDVLLHALPLFHTHGLFTATNTSMMAGASMTLLPRFDLDGVFAHLPEATTMMGVPTFYTRLLADSRLARARVAHMRLFISGSAPLLPETHRAWLDRTGHAILERYGMTETGMIASNPCDGERIAGTVGLPLPGVELRIADPQDGSPLPSGQVGMIELRGLNVSSSLLKNLARSNRQ